MPSPVGITESVASRNAALSGRAAFLDSGTGPGYFVMLNGDRPASGGAETTRLAKVLLNKPCGTVASARLTLASDDVPLCLADGDARWARFFNGNDEFAFDGDVSTVADGTGQVQLEDTALLAGGKVQMIYGYLDQP